MSYEVLARKWRPHTFAQLVGQDHVVRALINSLNKNRLHHAYLFSGTRGVGKTTIARIFAKALNCEQGVGSEPCGQCSTCKEVDAGRFVDLIEVDAASRTKVEETRELLDNVQYTPTMGRFKVYLIDEVHMFSGHSFNALLKTLEEPPPHVKFLLATTNPQKLPVTILSRCLQFHLRRLSPEQIHGQFVHILQQEAIEFEPTSLSSIVQSADGSMRDGLSILDQAIAFGGGRITTAAVEQMLGSIGCDHILTIIHQIIQGDAQAILQSVRDISQYTPDFIGIIRELARLFHQIAILQVAPNAIDDYAEKKPQILKLAEALSPQDVQLFYQIAIIGQRDLPLAPDLRIGLEMILLRMLAFKPNGFQISTPHPDLKVATNSSPTIASAPTLATPPPKTEKPNLSATASPVTHTDNANLDWNTVVAQLELRGMTHQLAINCRLAGRENNTISLTLQPIHAKLHSEKTNERLLEALEKYFNSKLKLVITTGEGHEQTPAQMQMKAKQQRQKEAETTIETDTNVAQMVDLFGARIEPGSIKPV